MERYDIKKVINFLQTEGVCLEDEFVNQGESCRRV